MKKTCIAFVITLLYSMLSAHAADSMRRLLTIPEHRIDSIFLGLSLNTRLDMIDYFDAGSETYSMDDTFGSPLRIAELSDRHVRFETRSPFVADCYLVTSGPDSLAVWTVTQPYDNGDTIIKTDDIRTGRPVETVYIPYSAWLVPGNDSRPADGELLAAIPFVTCSATVDAETGKVTLTNTSITVPGLEERIVEAFRPSLTLRLKGRKYIIDK